MRQRKIVIICVGTLQFRAVIGCSLIALIKCKDKISDLDEHGLFK